MAEIMKKRGGGFDPFGFDKFIHGGALKAMFYLI